MLSEKRLIPNKQMYTKEIRRYISERKEIKKKPSRSYGIDETAQQYLSYRIKRLDKIIDDKISDFNPQVIREKSVKMALSANKIQFGKLKKKLLPGVLR